MAKRKPKFPLLYEVKHKRKRFSQKEREIIYKRYDYKCNECFKDLSVGTRRKRVLDHIIPLSQLGSNKLSNIQLLCIECDKRKGSKVRPYAVKKRMEELLKKQEDRKRGRSK